MNPRSRTRYPLGFAIATLGTSLAGAQSTSCTSPLTAGACYERYLGVLQHASSLAELHPFLTAARVTLLAQGLTYARRAGADPEKVERVTLAILKRDAAAPVQITEQRSADGASLIVRRASATVKVRLVLEQGAWRIADEEVTSAR